MAGERQAAELFLSRCVRRGSVEKDSDREIAALEAVFGCSPQDRARGLLGRQVVDADRIPIAVDLHVVGQHLLARAEDKGLRMARADVAHRQPVRMDWDQRGLDEPRDTTRPSYQRMRAKSSSC
jgi:hypothetical protein